MDTVMKEQTVPAGYRVPVLVYHSVGDDFFSNPIYSMNPKDMEEHIICLRDLGYTFLTFEDLLNIEQIKKPLLMTFDDGYGDNYYNLFPLLKKYDVKAVISIICDEIGKKRMLTAKQIREMSDSGLVSVQSHTMSHKPFDTMSEAQFEYELAESKRRIGCITGKEPSAICYPMGIYQASNLQYVKKYYSYGIAGTGACFVTGLNNYEIGRLFMGRGLKATELKERISLYERNL